MIASADSVVVVVVEAAAGNSSRAAAVAVVVDDVPDTPNQGSNWSLLLHAPRSVRSVRASARSLF